MHGMERATGRIAARVAKGLAGLALMSILIATPPAAADHLLPGDRVGSNINEIADTLAKHGYVTLRYMNKEGRIEIVARKGNDTVFLLIDAATGLLETAVHQDGEPRLERPVVPAPQGDEESRRPAADHDADDTISALPSPDRTISPA